MGGKLSLLDYYHNSYLTASRPQMLRDKLEDFQGSTVYKAEYVTGSNFYLPVFNPQRDKFDFVKLSNAILDIKQFENGNCYIESKNGTARIFHIYSPNELFELLDCCEKYPLQNFDSYFGSLFENLCFIIPTMGKPIIATVKKAINTLSLEDLELLCRFLSGKTVSNDVYDLPSIESLQEVGNELYHINDSRERGYFPLFWSDKCYTNSNFPVRQLHLTTALGILPPKEQSISGTLHWLNTKGREQMLVLIQAIRQKSLMSMSSAETFNPLEVHKIRLHENQLTV